jgi:hypothetical protein
MHDLDEPGGFRPHRKKDHAADQLKAANIAKLESARYGDRYFPAPRFSGNGDTAVLRITQTMTVEFYTRRNRWKVRGHKKTTHGTVEQFIAFVRSQCGGQP